MCYSCKCFNPENLKPKPCKWKLLDKALEAQPSSLATGWVTLESAEFSWWQWRVLRKISVSAPQVALTEAPELLRNTHFQYYHLAKVTFCYIHLGENINPCIGKYWQPQECHFVIL